MKSIVKIDRSAAMALTSPRLPDRHARSSSLFGAHAGSVRMRDDVDLIASALDDELDAETGR